MATLCIKSSDELKEQAANAATSFGMSPHTFMVEAIKQATHNDNLRQANLALEQRNASI